jgi:glucose-1-phosphate thymidylyltransferase
MAVKGLILTHGADASPDERCPELFPVANKPILFHALDAMAAGGIRDVAICTSPERRRPLEEAVRSGSRWGLRVTLVTDERARPASAIHAAGEFLDGDPFLFQHGDGLLQDDIGSVVRAGSNPDLDAVLLMHRCGGSPAAAGAQLLGPAFALGSHQSLVDHSEDPEIAGLVRGLGQAGGRADVRLVRGWRRYGGRTAELLEINRVLLDEIADEAPTPSDSETRIEGRVRIHPTARVEASIIRGPALIGPGAQLSHAYVGPYTSIGRRVWLEGAEIEHSIVLPGAKIMQVGVRLEGSVIGRDARICRDFSLPRTMRVDLGDGARVVLQ